MKLVIDNMDSSSGWSGSGGASVYGTNEIAPYIAGGLSASLMFQFSELNGYTEKTYGTDVSDYEEFVMYIWSRNNSYNEYRKASDFDYKIDLGSGKEFYVPIFPGFNHFVLDISSIDTIDRIRITALHGSTDYVLISYAVAVLDELPLDIFKGIKEGLETRRDNLTSYLLGTVSGSAGDSTIDLSGLDFVSPYSTIKIDDGVNSEIHMLDKNNEGVFSFKDLYDGSTLVNDYSSASVYLHFPIEYGRETIEAIIPGIAIWGFEPERIPVTFDLDHYYDSWTNSGVSERKEGHYLRWPILLDCEARHDEILAHLTKIVRTFIGRKLVYINGRKFRLEFNSAPVESRPTEHFDIIPKVTYTGIIEIREELWEKTSLPKTDTITFQTLIQ